MTICPCCGFKFNGTLSDGCEECGAKSVGAALPKPANELPSYGRALVLVVTGALMLLVFTTQTIIAMAQRSSGALERLFQFWQWIAAGETAAWRLKWISIPVLFVTLWLGLKIYRSIKLQPERFCGLKYARRGLLASAVVGLLIALLIGITVPDRLRQRQMSIDATHAARANALKVVLHRYKELHNRLPDQATVMEELSTLPDPDGMVRLALTGFEATGYQPRGEVAAIGQKGRNPRGDIIRKASFNTATDDTSPAGLVFTDYDLRLPGEDKILLTEDDWVVGRDGVIMRLADVAKGGVGRSVSAGVLNP